MQNMKSNMQNGCCGNFMRVRVRFRLRVRVRVIRSVILHITFRILHAEFPHVTQHPIRPVYRGGIFMMLWYLISSQ